MEKATNQIARKQYLIPKNTVETTVGDVQEEIADVKERVARGRLENKYLK